MPEAYASSIDRLRELIGTARDPQGHAFAMIAEYLRRDGKLDEARGVVEEGLQAHPDFVSGHVVAAHVLTELGDLEQARVALTRVLALDAKNTRAPALKQGLVAAEEKAAVEWARAQGAGPPVQVDDEVVTVTLGALYLEQGEPRKAAEVARHILKTDPTHVAALALLAKIEGGVTEAEPASTEEPGAPEAPVEATTVTDLAPIAVPVEELGPDAVPIASLAPDAVPVEDLAPDAGSAADAGSTATAESAAPAPSTAPADPPVAVPEAVPIAHLAPDTPSPATSSTTTPPEDAAAGADGGEDIDDFMDWLDEN